MNEVFDDTPDYLQLPGDDGTIKGVRETAIWPPASPDRMPFLSQPPTYGAHTGQVLSQVLGMSSSEISELIQSGIVEQG